MLYIKYRPGPRRTSCLTCRQRRKKCDLTRPACERCLKGGYHCLGYNHSEPHEGAHGEGSNISTPSQSQPMTTVAPVLPSSLGSIHSDALNYDPSHPASENYRYINGASSSYDHVTSIVGLSHTNGNYATTHAPEVYNCAWPRHQSQSSTPQDDPVPQYLDVMKPPHAVSVTQPDRNRLPKIIQALCASITPSVDATQVMTDAHLVQIIHEYRSHRAKYRFALPPPSIAGALLQGPKTMIWVMYLGAKLFQSLGENTHGAMVSKCIDWIDKLERKLGNFRSKALNGAADWLLTQLELAFLKFITIGCGSGYSVLQKALPVFLLLLAADPDLYVEHPGGNVVVSFPRTFGAPQYELKWFVMYDVVTSLLLGVSPLVEYGYDGECDSVSHGLEWIHGIPVALAHIISQVSSWRAGSRVAPLDDWRNLERRVLAWQPQLTVIEDEELGGITTKLAIQEGWRHVTLIYIYMGMCGASSHDPRVQTSIKELIRLGEPADNLPIEVHVFVHCVVAGLGARYEKHRSIVHKKLLSFEGTRVWLFHGLEFSRVLEHLWYGVGAGGAAVIWDDYVQSRCSVVSL